MPANAAPEGTSPPAGPRTRHQAPEVGAFLLEEILHWALARKQPHKLVA